MLTFIRNATNPRQAHYKCSCGKETVVFKSNASRGHTRSCGCERVALTRERFTIHGHKSAGKRTRTYVAWINMKARCNNPDRPDYVNYGGRGIGYCAAWESFDGFLSDMGEAPKGMTLDRTDNSEGYSKANCRWVPRSTQNLNKRNCVRYEFTGKSLTLAEWSRETGIGRITLLKRIQAGIPLELALTVRGFLGYRRSLK